MSESSLRLDPAPPAPPAVSSSDTEPRPVRPVRSVPTFPPPAPNELDVTILMPCLDEARTLPQCIEWAKEALQRLEDEQHLSGEILIADNGSRDGSPELAESLGARVVHCSVQGYGAALRFGSLSARGRYIVVGDADASYDFRDAVPMLERLVLGADLCMGSRFTGTILPGAMPWKNRYIGNPVLTGILNLFFRSGFSDAHCGLRAFTKRAFLEINPTSLGMEFASEMVIKAALLNCKRAEVPIILRPDGRGRHPHLKPFRDGWRHLRYLIMLSPVWLYLLPGLGFVAVGALLFTLLLSTAPGGVFAIGPIWFGDHWMALAMGTTVCGHLSVLFALAATLVGIRQGYRQVTPMTAFLYRCSRLETQLLLGTFFIAVGVLTIGNVVFVWAGDHFGALSMERYMIAGTTALVLGVQSFFGAFLLSVIAGNESDIEKAVAEATRRRLRAAEPR